MLPTLLVGAAVVLLLIVVSLALRSALAKRPQRLEGGAQEIAPCPASPNCVSSRSTHAARRVEPLAFEGPPEAALRRLGDLVEALPRTRIVAAEGFYLHAECTSLLFRFVDDLELLVDEDASVVHVRSASRVGHSDLGVNRRRIEGLRARFSP